MLSLLLRVVPPPAAGSAVPVSVVDAVLGHLPASTSAAALAVSALDALDLRPSLYPLASAAAGLLHHDPSPELAVSIVHIAGAKKEGVVRAAAAGTSITGSAHHASLPYVLVEDATDSTVVLALASGCVDVVGCARSTIILGPAALHVTIDGCDNCTVVSASAHVTVHNCTDTTVLLWAEHRPLLLGDNRRLRLGPYAARYRGLAAQCAVAQLRGAQAAVAAGSGRETLVAALQLAQLGGRGAVALSKAPLPPCMQFASALSCNFWSRPVEVRFTSSHHPSPANSIAASSSEEADVTGLISPTSGSTDASAAFVASAAISALDEIDSEPTRVSELLGRCGARDAWSILPPALFTWKAAPACSGGTLVSEAKVQSASELVLAGTAESSAVAAYTTAASSVANGGAVIGVTRGDGQSADVLLPPLAAHDAERQHLALPWAYAAELDARFAAEQRLRKRIDEVLSELGPEAAGKLQAAVHAAFAVSA